MSSNDTTSTSDSFFELSIGDIEELLFIAIFLVSLWTLGRCFEGVGLPAYLGQIIAGVVLGPQVLDVVPFTSEIEIEGSGRTIWSILGSIGALVFLFESGLSVNLKQISVVIRRAVVIAFIGAVGPITLAYFTFAVILSVDLFPSTFSASIALAPTSIGLTTRLLLETRQFQTLAGQTILAASFLDDVIGLSLFIVALAVASDNVLVETVPLLFIYILLMVAFGIFMALFGFPRVHKLIYSAVKEKRTRDLQPRDEIFLVIMVATLFLFGYVGAVIGSELIGTFVAGISFSTVGRARFVWTQQTENINQWLLRFFFGATVAFSIPVDAMLDVTAFWNGLVVAILPVFCGKLLCNFAAKDKKSRWIIGFALVTRGEFAFIMAETFRRTPYEASDNPGETMMSEQVYSSLVWGLILAMFLLPFIFTWIAKQGIKGSGPKKLKIEFTGTHHTNILYELQEVFHRHQLEILAATVDSDGNRDDDSFIVHLRGDRSMESALIERLKRDLHHTLQWGDAEDRITITEIEPEIALDYGPPMLDLDDKKNASALATVDDELQNGPVGVLKKVESLQSFTSITSVKSTGETKAWLEVKFDPKDETDARSVSDQLRDNMTSNNFQNQQVIYDQKRSRIYLLEDKADSPEEINEERVKILKLVHDYLQDPETSSKWKISTNFDAYEDVVNEPSI